MALEDGLVLAHSMARQPEDLPQAFEAYTRARVSRARRVASASRTNGTLYHLSGPSAFSRNLVLGAVPAHRLIARYDWLYGWSPPANT